jgi:hypothetical protein
MLLVHDGITAHPGADSTPLGIDVISLPSKQRIAEEELETVTG